MKILPASVSKLIESFERLPGIGPKTAQRLTFYLLHVPQHELDSFSDSLKNLRLSTKTCSVCFNVGETDPCVICSSTERVISTVLVVESPIDILSIERTGKYTGLYHVLHGAISPLQNIGPDEIRIAELLVRLRNENSVKELILATNSTMEGEATAMYIAREIKNKNLSVKVTRLAQGLPVGGDLEYADDVTLGHALSGRREY